MRGKDIPLMTCYRITEHGTETFKKPKYELKSKAEIMKKQEDLGENAGWYFGTWCEKCCDVFPALMTEDSFENKAYYVCLVCGKESKHFGMPWQCRDSWNKGEYLWKPEEEGYQMTIFDY